MSPLSLFLLTCSSSLLLSAAHAQAPAEAVPAAASVEPAAVLEGSAPVVAAPAAAGIREIQFERDLQVQTDPMLQGLEATRTLTFTVPHAWTLQADPVVEIAFDHSSALDPGRSSLTVQVNDQAAATVTLDAATAQGGTLRLAIPRHLLVDYNKLKISVVQHLVDECEDPFDPALWTRVSRTSVLRFDVVEAPIVPDLALFPAPFYDPLGYGPVELSLIGQGSPSAATVEALGTVAVGLGRISGYRTLRLQEPVADPSLLQSHGLIVGRIDENPLIASLLGPTSIPAGEGLVVVVPAPGAPSRAILIVTGADEAGLKRAAQAVASRYRYELLSGSRSQIRAVDRATPPANNRDPRPVPYHDEAFTLSDLGIKDTTVRGYYSEAVEVPLIFEGDGHVNPEGGVFDLVYSYGAQLDLRLSTVEVRLNGIVLRSAALDSRDGEQLRHLRVTLPADLTEQKSNLEVVFHLYPEDFDPCRRTSDKAIWATVHGSSSIESPRYYTAMVPDLGLLRFDLWPFAEPASAGGTLVVIDDAPSWADASAGLQIVAELTSRNMDEQPSIGLFAGRKGLLGERANQQALVLVGEGGNSAFDELVASGRVTMQGDLDRALSDGAGAGLLNVGNERAFATIEQLIRSENKDRLALVLRAGTDADLQGAVQSLSDPSRLARFSGNAVALPESGGIRPVSVAARRPMGEEPVRVTWMNTLRKNWWLLGISLVAAAVAFGKAVSIFARNRGGRT